MNSDQQINLKDIPEDIGVPLSVAHRAYADPESVAWFNETAKPAGRDTARICSFPEISDGMISMRLFPLDEHKRATDIVVGDLLKKLKDERLIATGISVGSDGQDQDSPRRRIPGNTFYSQTLVINWPEETISGSDLSFVGVRIASPSDFSEFAESLDGVTLSEAFNRLVVDDWPRREQETFSRKRYPYWDFNTIASRFMGGHLWLVRLEDWNAPADAVGLLQHTVAMSDRVCPDPPDAVVEIRRRLERKVKQFIEWLRQGIITAEGVIEPADHALTRLAIPVAWWSRQDTYLDVKNDTLLVREGNKDVPKFSDIRIISPNPLPQTTEPSPEFSESVDTRRPYGDGETAIWRHLREKKIRDPQYLRVTKKSQIARDLSDLQEFRSYKFGSIETYVRRILNDPEF